MLSRFFGLTRTAVALALALAATVTTASPMLVGPVSALPAWDSPSWDLDPGYDGKRPADDLDDSLGNDGKVKPRPPRPIRPIDPRLPNSGTGLDLWFREMMKNLDSVPTKGDRVCRDHQSNFGDITFLPQQCNACRNAVQKKVNDYRKETNALIRQANRIPAMPWDLTSEEIARLQIPAERLMIEIRDFAHGEYLDICREAALKVRVPSRPAPPRPRPPVRR